MRERFEELFPRAAGSGKGAKRRHYGLMAVGILILLAVPAFFASCGGSNKSNTAPPPVPSILNINNSTDPSSPINLPIEINGSGFQSAPGQVVFSQSSTGITASVTPNSGGWTDSGTVVTVPSGDGTNQFAVPGTVSVTVKTSGGTSNAVTLTLVQTLTFQVNNVYWTTTTPLLTALSGLAAVAVPVSDTSAYVVTTGGYDGTGNTDNVYVGTLDTTGQISGWTADPDVLPETIAHHAMVESNPGNSLVAKGKAYLYVIGGQVNSSDAPGGTADVYQASFNPASGAVGSWTQLTSSSLPEPLVGPAAALFNGYVYVVGGLHPDGTPSSDVFSAPVKPDGTLGTWTKSDNAYPTPVSFATAFGFAGKLYVLDGDGGTSTNPNEEGSSNSGVTNVNFASALDGSVGTWTTTSPTIKNRKKGITWTAFGQIIDAEGIYEGNPGSQELERTQVNSDSTLASWNGITAVNAPGANVYNAAAIVSPLQSPTATPRFILLGGQAFNGTTAGGATPSATVYYNNKP